MRERSFAIVRSRIDITTFGKGEKFRIALKLSSELRIRCGPWLTGYVLHRFLLALYTNLAADEAKLGI